MQRPRVNRQATYSGSTRIAFLGLPTGLSDSTLAAGAREALHGVWHALVVGQKLTSVTRNSGVYTEQCKFTRSSGFFHGTAIIRLVLAHGLVCTITRTIGSPGVARLARRKKSAFR